MKADALAGTRVFDAMRHGVLTCQAETPLRVVAMMMAEHRIHSVVVTNLDGVSESAWGIVSDVDVVRSASEDAESRTAGEVAATELLKVSSEETLDRAAQLMAEHEVTHLVVVDADKPIGVLSSLDIAAELALPAPDAAR
jgi:CBS domain-containing protein